MEKKNLITPKKLQGFWELMPKEQILFSSILNKLEEVFKQNCFVPLDTPVLEYSEALLAKSGGDTDKEVYRFTKGSTDMCMRYDLTVPLARFVSMHKEELAFPFKRYQIGKVYRGERPQKGRFREFYQCDADIIGNETLSMVADAECVNLFEKCFNALNLDVEIRVSNRKILSGTFSYALTKVAAIKDIQHQHSANILIYRTHPLLIGSAQIEMGCHTEYLRQFPDSQFFKACTENIRKFLIGEFGNKCCPITQVTNAHTCIDKMPISMEQ